MNKLFYISFGQVHVHNLINLTLDKDCLLEIKAADYNDARMWAFQSFGNQYATVYSEEELPGIINYFPRGVVRL